MTKSEIVRKMALRFGPILAENNKREQEALQGYYALLNDIDGYAYDMAVGPDGKCDQVVLKFWKDLKSFASRLKSSLRTNLITRQRFTSL